VPAGHGMVLDSNNDVTGENLSAGSPVLELGLNSKPVELE